MIKFQSLLIQNFMSIGQARIDFGDDTDFVLIDAENHCKEDNSKSNGSGKSSIFESLVWCLTGETIRGYKDVVNRFQDNDCEVSVRLLYNNDNWNIIRRRLKKGGQSLQLYRNELELEYKGLRDAEEVLSKNLPELTMKFLGSTVVLGQGLPQRFTNNSPSGRKAILEELSNADYMIEHVKQNIKRRYEELSNQLRSLEDKKLAVSAQKTLNEQTAKKVNDVLEKLEQFDCDTALLELKNLEESGKKEASEKSKYEEEYDKISKDLEAMNLEKSKLESIAENDIQNEKMKIMSDIHDFTAHEDLEASKKIDEIRKSRESLQTDKYTIEVKLKEAKAKASGGICPTCGQLMPNTSQEEVDKAKKDVENFQLELSNISDKIDKSGDEILQIKRLSLSTKSNYESLKNSQLSKFTMDKTNKLNQDLESLNTKILSLGMDKAKVHSLMTSSSDRVIELRIQYRELRDKINSHQTQVDEQKKELSRLINEITDQTSLIKSLTLDCEKLTEKMKVNKSMETFASRDFRGILLANIVDELDQILKNYAMTVYGSPLTRFYQEGNSIGIEFDGKEYESLSGGEKQKLDVLIQLSLRDLITRTSGVEANIVCFDEVFDGLDSVGCEAIIQVLLDLGLQTYVITHRRELNIPYDRTITVIKEQNKIAHLEIR